MVLIHFGKCSINSLLYLFYTIFALLDVFLSSSKIHIKDEKESQNKSLQLAFTFILLMFISEFIFGIIGILFLLCLNHCFKTEEEKSLNSDLKILTDDPMRNNIIKYVKLFLIYIFEIISTLSLILDKGNELNNLNYILKLFLLIFTSIFTSCYLKYSIYKHHLLGLSILCLGFLLNDLMSVNEIFSKKWSLFLLFIIIQGPNALREILEKDLIEKNFYSIYKLLIIEGLIGIIFSLILMFILNSFNSDYAFYLDFNVLLTILLFVSCGLYNICRLKINQIYGPIHRCVGDTFVSFVLWMIDFLNNKEKLLKNYIDGLSFIICIFGTLIFTEIIIVDVFNFNINTREQQVKRANQKIENRDFFL